MREWFIVIGLIVITGILLDGWRRMRGGKGKLKSKLDCSFTNLPDDDGDSTKLLGPTRMVERHKPPFDEQDLSSVDAREAKERKGGKRQEGPRQGDLDPDEGLALETDPGDAAEPVEPRRDKLEGRKGKEQGRTLAVAAEPAPVGEVLIISAIVRDESSFKGSASLQNILENGLRFGGMDIFHRHKSMADNGEILFSMANAVELGTFDLDDIDNFNTHTVSFLLGLSGPRHPKQAFNATVVTARELARELSGELENEQRDVLTVQIIGHYRQRIIDHERRGLMQKRWSGHSPFLHAGEGANYSIEQPRLLFPSYGLPS